MLAASGRMCSTSAAGAAAATPNTSSSGAYDDASSPANNADCPPCECPATSTRSLAPDPLERARGTRRVEHTAALALTDEVRVHAGSAESLVVGGGDDVARVDELLHERDRVVAASALFDGAHWSPSPVGAVRPRHHRTPALRRAPRSARRPRPTPRCRDRRPRASGTAPSTPSRPTARRSASSG